MIKQLFKQLSKTSLALILCSTVAAEPFVFTAIPDADETRLNARFSKVADYLEQQLGVEVNYIPVKSYAAAVSAFRNDQVQLAWFGGLTGVQARRLTPGSEAIAQGAEDPKFRSYFIAHHSTGLNNGEQLSEKIKGMSFSFGSKSSTSGRLMPEFYLQQQFQQTPEQLFSRVGFSGNHSRTIALVQSGSYQLGALNYQVWLKELAEGKIDLDKVSIIWTTPDYTDYQWTVRGDVDQRWGAGFKEKITKALLDMKDPALLNAFPRKAFIPASNADYQAIEDTARDIGLLD
ncbi:putative selenate ABC transporter substrate-binding protein [Oceanicoccus sagamiensis]|uniref:Putative selenate ABC transporter substrate-binding protein n=1 Tax=Oceanicoccus sagamiensis TaxID=716816 RepID=A0A1X9NK42_9GAMM|nr:putative selenate ABC transporter substrate-binding protein [Oceanicoccus sagamiensis]ARN76195.1 putative selenate ABC transporter substrate-binding protein [Oceanicoccus sagamiensis]